MRKRKIVQIARDAANNREYAAYDDYNEALRKEICQEK